MADLRKLGSTSNLVRFTLKDKTTGQGKTGLSISTSGLIISTICDNEATATPYTQAGATLETIATLGTFAAPTATKCRFKEVDSTSHKGLYEFQFADARFVVSNSKRLVISVNDAEATILDADYEIDLVGFDPFAALATPTNITAGTITTTTNLTNAPTAGDLTATMKASITTAATAATPTVTAGTVSDKTGYSLAVAPPTAIAIADACLIRDWTAVVGTVATRSTLNALRFLRNKWTLSGSTLTVFDEVGGTAWTSTVTATAGADPVTATNPS